MIRATLSAECDKSLDLPALMLLTPQRRAQLDEAAHGLLWLSEYCFHGGACLMTSPYTSFVAALAHADELISWTPDAFTPDHGPIKLVLTEVAW